MDAKELEAKMESARELKDAIGNILEEHNADLDVSISVLMAMATEASVFQAEMRPEVVIAKFASAMCKLIDLAEAEEEKEEIKWLN